MLKLCINEDLSFFTAKINGEPATVAPMRHVMSLNFPVPSRSFQTELVDNIKTSNKFDIAD